jgi:hypothetical protein
MKIRCYYLLLLWCFCYPLKASFDLTDDERAAIERQFEPLTIEDFKATYIDRNKPFHVIEHAGDRRKLYAKWIKKNGSNIPLYLWTLLEAGIPKEGVKSAECEMCGHKELGTLNKATHAKFDDSSIFLFRYIGNRCITYATKTLEELYEDYIASLPDAKQKALTEAVEKKRVEQEKLLTQADRVVPCARKIVDDDTSSSEDEEAKAARRRASLRSNGKHGLMPSKSNTAANAVSISDSDDETERTALTYSPYRTPLSRSIVHIASHRSKRVCVVSDSDTDDDMALSTSVSATPVTPQSSHIVPSSSSHSQPPFDMVAFSARRSLFGSSPLAGWQKNIKGNYRKGMATIFSTKDGCWKYVLDGKFATREYRTPEEAAQAFSREYVH